MLENEILLCKWTGSTAQFRTLEAGVGPAINVRVGYFSSSQFHNGFASVRRDGVHCADKTMYDRMAIYREQ